MDASWETQSSSENLEGGVLVVVFHVQQKEEIYKQKGKGRGRACVRQSRGNENISYVITSLT